MPTTPALAALVLTLHAGLLQDAPDRVISTQGVELRNDERVFTLFAALNGLGFAEETARKGPPLRAPEFHPLRVKIQDAMRKANESGQLAGVRQLFEEHPAELEVYLQAVLGGEGLSKEAERLASGLGVLETFRQKADVAKLFDSVALEQRALAKDLKTKIERDFSSGTRLLGLKDLRAPTTLVVVPNPLDGHDSVRVVRSKDTTYLIVGPGLVTASRAVLETSLRARLAPAVDATWSTAPGAKFAKSWDGLKGSPRIGRSWSDGKAYLTDTLARVLTFKVRSKTQEPKEKRESEEDFLDEATRSDLRWARALLRALDGQEGAEPIDTALPKILSRVLL